MQSDAHSPMDFKGNVKIHSVHSLIPVTGPWAPQHWRQVDKSQPVSYSSLLGVPVAGLRDEVNTTFQILSRHWSVNCSAMEHHKMTYADVKGAETWDRAFQIDLALPKNNTTHQSVWPMQFRSLRGDSRAEVFDDQHARAQSDERYWPLLPINRGKCSIGAQDVHANVSCIGKDCEVNAMSLLNEVKHRSMPGIYPNSFNVLDNSFDRFPLNTKDVWNPGVWDNDRNDESTDTELSSPGWPVMGLRMVLNTLPLATKINDEHFPVLEKLQIAPVYARYMNGIGATAAELWLTSNNTEYVSTEYYPWPDYSYVKLEDFSVRLEALINTWWQSFYMPLYLEGKFLDNPDFDHADRPIFPLWQPSVPWNTTSANISEQGDVVYMCHWGWVMVLLVTSLFLLIAAIATIGLDCVTIAPDIFGFASSATRDNFYLPEYGERSYLDGFQRARALGDVQFRIGDAKPRAAVGYIALMTDLGAPKMLRRERKYD